MVFASVFNSIGSDVITESVATGSSVSPSLAIVKGLVELVERKAFSDGRSKGHPACQTLRSDGFAAFPAVLHSGSYARHKARENAYLEACERFVWSTWWDNPRIGHYITSFDAHEGAKIHPLIENIQTHSPITAIHVIEPLVCTEVKFSVRILLVELQGGGYITGGAAARSDKKSSIILLERAASELFRHALALKRLNEYKKAPETFYQERLAYFGFGDGYDDVRARLAAGGTQPITLPGLTIDAALEHDLSDVVAVHRCLFDGQPPFIGGRVQRLCI